MQELETQLRNDLSKIGLDVEFNLSLRKYSKSYYGRYDVVTSTIIVYVHKNPNGDMYSYEDILLTTIHEAIHCKQWHDPNYKRLRGVMHDTEFKRLYALYSNRARARILLRKVINYDSFYKACGREVYDNIGVRC